MKAVSALLALFFAFATHAANVEGYVYSADGTAVADATVTIYIPEGSVEKSQRLEKQGARSAVASGKTEEGRFAFSDVPESVIDVDVRAEGFAPVLVRTIAGDLPLAVTLQPARMVEGRVTAQGKPVANAYVVWSGMHGVEFAATTDANGRYRVPDPRRWAHEPKVFHPSFAPLADTGRGVEGTNFELQARGKEQKAALAGKASITGVVKIGDKPLAGVPVVVQGGGEQFIPAVRVITDAKGRYSATGLVAARTYVMAGEGLEPRIRTSNASIDVEPAAIDLRKENSATFDITLIQAPLVTGRVVDADGKPVKAAHVQVITAGRPAYEFMHDPAARTLPDGRYAIAAPMFFETDMMQVAVFAPATSTVLSTSFSAKRGGDMMNVNVTLPRFETVTLRVIDRERKPVPNARVAFTDSDDMREIGMMLQEPFASRATRGNAAGEVVLQLARGAYDFAVDAPGFQMAVLEGQSVSKPRVLDVTLDVALTIRGRVHRKGVGVANVQILLLDHERPGRAEPIATDAEGRFEVGGLARGTHRLGFYKHDELLQRTVTAEAPSTVDVALPPAGAIQGRVVEAGTRQPVQDLTYTIEPLDPQDEENRFGSPVLHRARASSDGRFTEIVPAGSYRVTAAANGYTHSDPVEVRVREDEPVELTIELDRGITVSGRVTDDAGTPIDAAEVFVVNAQGDHRNNKRSAPRVAPGNATSSADGTFTIGGIEPGLVSVMARRDGFVPFRKVLEASTATTLDIRLSRGLTIEGVVTRGGKPLADVQVSAMTAAIGGDHQPATSDRNGRFVLQGLIPARYTVSAHREAAHAQLHDVDPSRQREIAISLDPQPEAVLFGTVTGLPRLEGKITRRVVFVHTNERGVEGLIDDSGNYRIENAPAGQATVTAQIESTTGARSSEPRRVELAAGHEVRVDLDVAGTTTVTGRVTHEGKPLEGVRVIFSNTAGVGASSSTRPDGAYEVSLPSAGTYQIFVHADRRVSRPFQSVREIRGGETVDIDVREQTIEGTVVDAETRQPIAGALVTLAPETGAAELVAGEAPVNASGRFRILTAAAGAHRAIAWAPGYAQRSQPIVLGTSRGAQLAFELQKVEPLRVRVHDARTGTPLGTHLIVTTESGAPVPVRAESSPDGEWYLFSLARGKYRVVAVVQGYESKVVEVSAPGSTEIGM